ncbi:MAG: hypothetical protein EHM89_02270 [Acidobacteria bacterium]|nr:MAG: hypothetical protein EHM89_02270 [Acidobacteriota bacterium]
MVTRIVTARNLQRNRREVMDVSEVLFEYSGVVSASDGRTFRARACGRETTRGLWQGWIEFLPVDDSGLPLRSPRETTQPNRTDTHYWATGLTPIYLEGALKRALAAQRSIPAPPRSVPIFDDPAPASVTATEPERVSAVDPFSLYEKGEMLLRQELGALATWRLLNMVEVYGLSERPVGELSRLPREALFNLIVAGVKRERRPAVGPP